MSEEVFFLGYPFGLSFDIGAAGWGHPLPLVKRATLSAFKLDEGLLLLDGHNNPGFSGGPVVRSAARRGMTTSTVADPQVIAVVSGYRRDQGRVLDDAGFEGPYTYDVNTGIVYGL